ncbi:hypothetical protein VTH82DRAFT_2928 [Thermothelomyces myriococcoides]
MEVPPAKRPRFGPAPFEDPNYDDPEADELNEQPEEVNARRDPAVRLERSRAFAALKLKSAFERIFEKYSHDFTGVADEIDLRTGEIVVDNGHIQSLKDAQLGGSDESDAEGSDDASATGPLNEEDRVLRGTRVENRLSQIGQTMMPSTSPRHGAIPLSAQGWPGPPPNLAGPSPGLSGVTYPGHVPFGEPLVQPIPVPATDPVWRAPDLPVPLAKNGPPSGGLTGSARKKVARLSLSTAQEQGGDNEDDILLGPAALEKDKENIGGLTVKQKVLQQRPPQEKAPTKKRGRPKGSGRKSVEGRVSRVGKSPKTPKAAAKTGESKGTAVGKKTPLARPASGSKSPSKVKGTRLRPKDRAAGINTAPTPAKTEDEARESSVPGPSGPTSNGTPGSLPETREPTPEQSNVPNQMEAEPDSDEAYPDLYVDFSGEKEKLAKKPQNQILRVEIEAKTPHDPRAFTSLTPQPTDEESQATHTDAPDNSDIQTDPIRSNTQDVHLPDQSGHTIVKDRNARQETATEVFSRNLVDPAYAFSDDEEPTLPKKAPQPKFTKKHVNSRYGVSGELHSQKDAAMTSSSEEAEGDEVAHELGDSVGMREQSPTLSLNLDDTESRQAGSTLLRPEEDKDTSSCKLSSPGAGDGQAGDEELLSFAENGANSKTGVEGPPIIQPSSDAQTAEPKSKAFIEAVETTVLEKCRSQETPVRTARKPFGPRRTSREPPRREEIPETSPNNQEPISSRTAARTLEIENSDPPSPTAGEQDQDASTHPAMAPSPTLSDPTPNAQPSPSLSRQEEPASQSPPPSGTPRTPVKATTSHAHRRSSQSRRRSVATATTTTKRTTASTTTTTKKKSASVLSLLKAFGTNSKGGDGQDKGKDEDDEDDEDELSFLTPRKPAPPPSAVRSTPAGHHVRSGLLLAPGTPSAGRGGQKGRRWRKSVPGGGPTTPSGSASASSSSSRFLLASAAAAATDESELVRTPGGTMRRCGEGGFRCERDFCFSCL